MKHWNELTPLEQAHETYSDMYKDAHGVRPHNDVSNWTLADFEKEFEYLGRVIKEDMEREEAEQERAINDFEARVRATIEAGAKDRATAIRWIDTATAEQHEKEVISGAIWHNPPCQPHQLICLESGTIIEVSTPDSVEDNYRVFPGDSQK